MISIFVYVSTIVNYNAISENLYLIYENNRFQALYSEIYNNVAVFFASVSNRSELCAKLNDGDDKQEIGIIRILNDIIIDFDKVRFRKKYFLYSIE